MNVRCVNNWVDVLATCLISGRYSLWSLFATRCIISNNIDGAAGALHNMNALLDEEHRIAVGTDIYDEVIKQQTKFECNNCTMLIDKQIGKDEKGEPIIKKVIVQNKINRSDIQVIEVLLSSITSLVLQSKTIKVWICPNCKTQNELLGTNIIQPSTENPYYYKTVPECPIRSDGCASRLGYKQKFHAWFYNYSEELENAMMEYRISYVAQHGVDMDESIGEKLDIP